MKLIMSLMLTLIFTGNAWSESKSLDQLLRDVKQAQQLERKINHRREAEFLAEKKTQQRLLQAAQAKLAAEEALSEQLKQQLEHNEALLAKLEGELKNKSGELGELFGVARQVAGDLVADLTSSLVSAQYPEREKPLVNMIDSKALPTITQLETLWFTLQQEMTEAGKVVRFNTEIQSATGAREQAEVIRIGAFNAIAKGGYLRYSPDTHILDSLARQPSSQYLDLLHAFAQTQTGIAPIAIDPTRGVMLSMLIQTPDTVERIEQGGVIGFIILALGAVGFLYALLRLAILMLTGSKMTQQMDSAQALDDNPLGRVLLATEKSGSQDAETLELVLDEAITREVPALEKGLSLIKLFAAVAPLLGLLGTVTGMIATFQSISLFGTGDPKLMADGISQALVTTMLGLCVAIPLLFLYNLLASRSKTLVQILDEQSAGIMSRRMGN